MSLISGVNVEVGGKTYIIPPLNFATLKRLQPVIESLSNISVKMTSEQIDNVGVVIQGALQRNYPEITIDEIMEWLDLGNANTILKAIMGVSGIKTVGEQTAASVNP